MKKGLGSMPNFLVWIDAANDNIRPSEKIDHALAPTDALPAATTSKLTKEHLHSTKKGLPTGWTRSTFIVEQDINEKLKALAYWERLSIKEVIHEALSQYLNGKNVKAIPKKRLPVQ